MLRALAVALLLIFVGQQAHAGSPRPYLLHLPGIGGLLKVDANLLSGLRSGVEVDCDSYDWTCNDPGLNALGNLARNRAEAEVIAGRIRQAFAADPQRPIYLTCHSGGAGLAVWALEMLPEEVMVETVLFLAPALSPGYDLSAALRHVRGKAYVFYSPHDPIVNLGTKTFGTIDRVNVPAAGAVGFVRPGKADPTQYAKLSPMPYQKDWMQQGNNGGHIGPMSRRFAQQILAPLLAGSGAVSAGPATRPVAVMAD